MSGQREEAGATAEQRAMEGAIGRALNRWNAIENRLCLLLATMVNHDDLASTIYFTPTNFDTRCKIVKNCLQVTAWKWKAHGPAKECWAALERRLDRAQQLRNLVAHGSITRITANGGAAQIRLTPQMTDTRRFRTAAERRQIPGLSQADVDAAAENWLRLMRWTQRFGALLDQARAAGNNFSKTADAITALRDEIRSTAHPRDR